MALTSSRRQLTVLRLLVLILGNKHVFFSCCYWDAKNTSVNALPDLSRPQGLGQGRDTPAMRTADYDLFF